ncbi:conserved hypothetical protein [Ricinus communis]|uniref:Uncharacterized protein n=1 Tax=Ricinus communis TaxID=3988 RepID=B9S3X3_RICCO|nr:conserved hypothetical protein [Ricinus communis]
MQLVNVALVEALGGPTCERKDSHTIISEGDPKTVIEMVNGMYPVSQGVSTVIDDIRD